MDLCAAEAAAQRLAQEEAGLDEKLSEAHL
jgi:hypothetical protein